MTTRDRALHGTMSWVDLQTPDLDAARKFYGALLGWSFVGGDDKDLGFYTTAMLNGRKVAGMAKLGKESPFPPAWSVYFAADSADDVAAKVTAAGGQVIAAPMDIPDQGRMAYFTDATGAYFGVWQNGKHKGAEVLDDVGTMAWHETYSRDAAKARAFYAEVFGLTVKTLDAPGIEYWTLHRTIDGKDQTVGGVMQMGAQFPADLPSRWNTYFAVTDADVAAKQVVEAGGKVIAPPFDTPYGRMLVATDPFGAQLCLIKTKGPAAGW